MSKFCVIDESKLCDDCKDCELCDLVKGKICDNCGQCLGINDDYKVITAKFLATDKQTLNEQKEKDESSNKKKIKTNHSLK